MLEVVVEVGLSVAVVCYLREQFRRRLVRDSMSIVVGRSTVVVLQVELEVVVSSVQLEVIVHSCARVTVVLTRVVPGVL